MHQKPFIEHVQEAFDSYKNQYGLPSYMKAETTRHENFDSFVGEHLLIPFSDDTRKQVKCFFCKVNRLKTKSGWPVLTRHKCQKCGVPLCKGQEKERPCHYLYHRSIYNGISPQEAHGIYIQEVYKQTDAYGHYTSDLQ